LSGLASAQRCGLAAHPAETGDEGVYEGDGLIAAAAPGAGAKTVVHQHHRAGTEERFYAAQHLWCRVAPPVVRVGAPVGEPQSEVIPELLRPGREHPPRWPPQSGLNPEATEHFEPFTGVVLDLAAGAARVARMLGAVELDLVTRLAGGGYDILVLDGERGDDKEGGAGAGAIEGVEYAGSPCGIRAVVEGQRGPG